MVSIRTLWVNLGIYVGAVLWTLISVALAFPAYWLLRVTGRFAQKEAMRMLIWVYGRIWIWIVSLFIHVETPTERPPEPCVYVVNHASFIDVYFIAAQPLWNVCLAVRNWPFRIPFYRPFMHLAGYVKTEKGDIALHDSIQTINRGGSMIFFPEGTRTSSGQLGRFHSGAFYTAIKANVPLVPLCISGTFNMLPRGARLLKNTNIEVRLLPPVYPANYQQSTNGHIQLKKDVKKLMIQALEEMSA